MNRGAAPLLPDAGIALGRVPAGARHVRILELVDRNGFVSVADITESFSLSEMTIRRDPVALEGKSMIARTHGGAVGVGRREVFDTSEPAFSSRRRTAACL
jgi:DeoR family transcriptional regulator, aga operon transcriptional repressor